MLDPTMDPTAFGYGDLNFSWGDHICAIYDDPGQQMDVAIPFMRQGIRVANDASGSRRRAPPEGFAIP